MKRLRLLVLLCTLFFAPRVAAQYYTWGSDAPMKWSTIRTPDVRMIFPDTVTALAQRTLFCIRTVQPDISFGFSHGPMRIPFVLHPENFRSNGLVMYLPKRVEFLTSPAIDGYSMLWYKQLVAHEYRHAVQYNNLNRGVVRVLNYLLGQQGSAIGLLFMPIWAMEGDAVMSETAMSSFGRGLQPSFSMGYRAQPPTGRERGNVDRWFCGSYRDYIPDHYQLGYQLCAYSYDRYGENIWNKAVRYSVRNPYVLATTHVALEKYYKTSVRALFRDTFDHLEEHWAAQPSVVESSRPLTAMPEKNYTTYRWPMPLDDSTALVVKSDYDRPSRLVRLNTHTGEEQRVCYTGAISSRPSVGGGRVWWTEYRRSKLFEQRVGSQLCYMELSEGRPRTFVGERNALYTTVIDRDDMAWVEYAPDGQYTIVRRRQGELTRFVVPDRKEIHGLAWDDRTIALYVIVTDDSGMWLARIDDDGLHAQTKGAYITLSDLRAANGKLYFGSIASGKDEAHCYDLLARRAYRITTSTYGSFAPMPTGDGANVLLTSYDRHGYHVATQPLIDSTLLPVASSHLPLNGLNPPYKRWEVVNLDSVRFAPADSLAQRDAFRTKRYRKVPNLVNVHSWMPLAFNPFAAVDEHTIDVNVGVTLLSQNLLSNTEAFASYGWNHNEGSLFKLGVRYFGLGVQFELDANYGGNQMFYSIAQRDPQTGMTLYQKRPSPDKYYSVGLSATLPLYFQRGYHTRQLSVWSNWNFSNGMVADLGKIEWHDGAITNFERIGFRKGLHKLAFGVGYSDQVALAHRDFAPRWGYVVSTAYTFNPSNTHFSDLISLYGQTYLPGVAAHNSLMVAATYQTSIGGYKFPSGYAPLNYRSTRLIPRGFTTAEILSNNYFALALNYQLPVWYPEGGIGSILYFKRIRLNVGGDYARFDIPTRSATASQHIWSVGGDLIFDINAFRQPAAATSTVKLSVYHPSSGGMWFSASVGLPF
ncbi:MAG: hypothetical protein RR270_06205 [Alistipes sp.]